MPKHKIPNEVKDLINTLQKATARFKEDKAITTEQELKDFNQASGERDYKANKELYAENASRILDFFVSHGLGIVEIVITKYDDGTLGTGRAALAILDRMTQFINPAAYYLDKGSCVPHITSEKLYNKMLWIEWILTKLDRYRNGPDPLGTIANNALKLAIEKRLPATKSRLDAYAKAHGITRMSIDDLEKQFTAGVQTTAENQGTVASAPIVEEQKTPAAISAPDKMKPLPTEEAAKAKECRGIAFVAELFEAKQDSDSAAVQQAKEQAEREAQEKAEAARLKEQAEREAQEKAEAARLKEQAEREAQEKAEAARLKEQAEREAQEKAEAARLKEQAEREAQEKAEAARLKEQAEREAQEKAEAARLKEQAEREAQEKAEADRLKEQAEREAQEKAEAARLKEQAEREAQEKAEAARLKEQAEREAQEKAEAAARSKAQTEHETKGTDQTDYGFVNVARPLPPKGIDKPVDSPSTSQAPTASPKPTTKKRNWGGFVGGFSFPYIVTIGLCLVFPAVALQIYGIGLAVSIVSMFLCRNLECFAIYKVNPAKPDVKTPGSTAAARSQLGIDAIPKADARNTDQAVDDQVINVDKASTPKPPQVLISQQPTPEDSGLGLGLRSVI